MLFCCKVQPHDMCTFYCWMFIEFTVFADCGDPTPVLGSANSTVFTYSSVLSISCDTGYSVTGTADITCQADGTWTGSPTCDPLGKISHNIAQAQFKKVVSTLTTLWH